MRAKGGAVGYRGVDGSRCSAPERPCGMEELAVEVSTKKSQDSGLRT